ncbi:Two component Transcriptional regulator, Winged helix family [Thiobacillus denitrificans ATCC 25259]|uniref:Two component Transcriptional regulator, Winged helix family n=1 Tax=Thiobacillus denitrificans (strain ATCC 25259 / T1) TaxID=292415 RepID=Q3SGE3_THIDA|nr:response regulator [Thiobacillus denitrificans]AAZ98307.1 Two component Transcriptional regulator, Winged helix family [Thiobacillus denitrificans ATCC 25259]
MGKETIYVTDDDRGIRELVAEYLTSQGYAVETAEDAAALDRLLAARLPDLVVLDWMMPGEDGLSVARRLRARPGFPPIIMLSAKGEDIDRIIGLEVGADDYLPKPFNPRELLARIRAVLRRQPTAAEPTESARLVRFGPFSVNLDARMLSRDGVEIPLTGGEYELLEIFVRHANRALSRDWLMDQLRGFERDPFDRSIDVRVNRLRKKIEDDPTNPAYIRTQRGQGYLFVPQGKG